MNNKKEIGIIGLGKMGINMAERLSNRGYRVVGYNRSEEPRLEAKKRGMEVVSSLEDLSSALSAPRVVWTMVSNDAVDKVLEEILPYLSEGDTVIDGANAFYKDSVRRANELKVRKINFLDAGFSGGPSGALNGACIMVGGEKDIFEKNEDLFRELSVPEGYRYVGHSGAGHFVKMVHNGIEYGMMQSIAEGFTLIKESDFEVNIKEVADLYSHGSVVESRLVSLLSKGLKDYGDQIDLISGVVNHSGMGEWTVGYAEEKGTAIPAIKSAYQFRLDSKENPSFTGKLLSLLRNMFGGHDMKK